MPIQKKALNILNSFAANLGFGVEGGKKNGKGPKTHSAPTDIVINFPPLKYPSANKKIEYGQEISDINCSITNYSNADKKCCLNLTLEDWIIQN